MNEIRNECKIEPWTLKQVYQALTRLETNDKGRIIIPMFQRGLRWDAKREKDFIESLTLNYPVGTLLFYKAIVNNQETYTLIDGLQRGNTIKKYLGCPTAFFSIDKIPQDKLDQVHALSGYKGGNIQEDFRKMDQIIVDYVKEQRCFDFQLLYLFKKLVAQFPSFGALPENDTKFIEIMEPVFKDLKLKNERLENSQIPVLIYSGDQSTLPAIFERINSKGVPLTEYEIFAASWPGEKFAITNNQVIYKIRDKYESLTKDNFVVAGYDPNELLQKKEVNSFDYVFGLSKWLTTNFPILRYGTNQKADETNPLAFQLINACFNDSYDNRNEVYNTILHFSKKTKQFEDCLTSCINYVSNHIAQITRFKGNKRDNQDRIFHSQFQILSYISYVFRKKYNLDTLEQRDDWQKTSKILDNNLWLYYVFDIVDDRWDQGGTRNLHQYAKDDRYLNPISCADFSASIDRYFQRSLSRKETKAIGGVQNEDFVILNTIYLKEFSAEDQLSLENFDVEHIAPKEQMKNYIARTHSVGLPISCLSNICYLPEGINRSKGAKNFYQDREYLTKAGVTLEQIEKKFSFTTKEELEWMDLDYHSEDGQALSNYYLEFLNNRYIEVKSKYLHALGFSDDDIKDAAFDSGVAVPKEPIQLLNEEEFYKNSSPATIAKTAIRYLFSSNSLTDDDVALLLDENESKERLGSDYAVLVDSYDHVYQSGYLRYANEPIEYKGKAYYVCTQYHLRNKDKLIAWIRSKL
jgi:hypothetical protein